jgi:hypothetical protein
MTERESDKNSNGSTDDEIDREYVARHALSKLMQAVAGIEDLAACIEGLQLNPAAQAQVAESLQTAKREATGAAVDLIKTMPARKPS